MKKTIFSALVLSTLMVNAQRTEHYGRMGLNTTTPNASWEVARHTDLPETSPQGVLFPKLSTAQRDKFILEQSKHEGMMIYNTDKKCLEMYLGVVSGVHQWNCLPDTGSSQQQNISITPVGFEGAFIQGVALNNTNKVKFKLINNSFSPVSNVDFSSAVSIQNGTANITIPTGQNNNVSLASGQETILAYTMNGNPENGTLTANFSRLGLTASQNTTVGMGRADIKDRKEYLVSLTYNGTNIQGKMDNNTHKFKVKIPYTNGLGSYAGFTQTKTTNIASGQGGDQNQLTLTIPAGNYGVNGELVGEITVGGADQEFLAKMLAPAGEEHITTFDVDMNGTQYKVELWAIGGIPDRNFNIQTDGAYKHRFIYLPIEVTGANGYRKTWLNNNLGAEYADANNPRGNFNPAQQAKAHNDHLAFGSLYQWQRPSDGHELITWTSATAGTPSATTSTLSNNANWTAGHSNFIINTSSSYSWVTDTINRDTSKHNLWQVNGANNPCPTGYHVPTMTEWEEIYKSLKTTHDNNNDWAMRGVFKLSGSAMRIISEPHLAGNVYSGYFRYWQSDKTMYEQQSAYFNANYGIVTGWSPYFGRATGYPIRCIKDE